MELIEVKSDINNKIELLIEHREINNNSYHLDYVLTNINNKFYFANSKSDIVTIRDNLICPYCLQKLIINRAYTKKNGISVRFFVKHKSKNEFSEGCIFKQKKIIGDNRDKVYKFYESKEFIQKSTIFMLKKEINKGFKIAIPTDYIISSEDRISIKFKYKHKKIVNIYPSSRKEFICRLRTDTNETIFCMLGENEINIRNKNKDIWRDNDVTIITFKKDKPYLNSDIEPKVNVHSNFYTTCLYSKAQDKAYEEYLIEHEKYKNVQRKIINTHGRKGNIKLYEKRDSVELDRKNEIDKYNNRKSLEIWVNHEIERVRVCLENKFGLRKISTDTWITNDGKYHKLKCIKVIKNSTYFYIQCPEIYVKHMELIGYKLEIVEN